MKNTDTILQFKKTALKQKAKVLLLMAGRIKRFFILKYLKKALKGLGEWKLGFVIYHLLRPRMEKIRGGLLNLVDLSAQKEKK